MPASHTSAVKGRDDAALGPDLLSVIVRLNRWATHHASPFDVPPAQARLLSQIESVEPARVGDLARADHSSQPTMTAHVQRLAEGGLIRRFPDPTDARAALVELTAKGRSVLRRVRKARSDALAPALAAVDDDVRAELATAVSALDRLLVAAVETRQP
jgi:DNA-binding MarR family transcriptional regulator